MRQFCHKDNRGNLIKPAVLHEVKETFTTYQKQDVIKGFHGFKEHVHKTVVVLTAEVTGFILNHDKTMENIPCTYKCGDMIYIKPGQYWGFRTLKEGTLLYLVSERFEDVTEDIYPITEIYPAYDDDAYLISRKDRGLE